MKRLFPVVVPISVLAALIALVLLVRSVRNRPMASGEHRETVVASLARVNPQLVLPADYYQWPVRFSPDGNRTAIPERGEGRGERFVIDGQPKPVYSDIAFMFFRWSPDSRRYGYTLRDYGVAGVVVDDQLFSGYVRIGSEGITFSDNSRHWFSRAVRQARGSGSPEQHVVLYDGVEIPSVPHLPPLKFAGPDNHLEAQDGSGERIGVDGQPLPPGTAVGPTPPGPVNPIMLNTPPPGSPPVTVNLKKIKHPRKPNTLGQPDPMNTYILTVNGKQIGEYTTVFPGPRADYRANADGTVTFYAVKDSNLVRLTVRP